MHTIPHTVSLSQRAGQKGTSYTFFTTENAKSARELINILRDAKADIPPQLQEMVQYGGGGGGRLRVGLGARVRVCVEVEVGPRLCVAVEVGRRQQPITI